MWRRPLPWLLASILAAIVAGLVAFASCGAPPADESAARGSSRLGDLRIFTVAGSPTSAKGSTATGALATDAAFGILEAIAAAPDGGFVVRTFSQRVLRIGPTGRIEELLNGGARRGYSGDGGPASRARVGELTDVAVGGDGSVFVADAENCNVRRIGPDGLIFTVTGQRRAAFPNNCRDLGDDGRADRARLCSPMSLDVTPADTLLIATGCGRVREIGRDGVIRLLAGGGAGTEAPDLLPGGVSEPARDGDDARSAELDGDGIQIATMPDGRLVIVEGVRVWLVDSDGRLRRVRGLPKNQFDVDVLPLADHSLLLSPHPQEGLLARWPDGRLEDLLSARAKGRHAGAHDGDAGPLSLAPVLPFDMAVAADGGLLLMDFDHVRYVAPDTPQRLAIGIARETVSSRLPLKVTLETTLPARVTVRVTARGRTLATTTVDLPAGRSEVRLPRASRRHLNVIAARARASNVTGPEQVAGDRLGVLPGRRLPRAVALRLLGEEADFIAERGGGRAGAHCRRFSSRRIDCGAVDDTCQGASSFQLRRDGVLTVRAYDGGDGPRCRLRARPGWRRPWAISLPT